MAPTATPSEIGFRVETSEQNDSGWSEWKDEAQRHGIDYDLYYGCVRSGKSPEEAATTPLGKRYRKKVLIAGIWAYKSEHCKRVGISRDTVKYRMRVHNLTFEEAIRIPVDTCKSRIQKDSPSNSET